LPTAGRVVTRLSYGEGEQRAAGGPAGRFGEPGAGLDQDGPDIVAARMARQHPDDVAALAGAQADQAHRPGRARSIASDSHNLTWRRRAASGEDGSSYAACQASQSIMQPIRP
jgi:hypothetical protein